MPKQTKVCRVCGNTYEACNSVRTGSSVFNWREVACSPLCGAKYFDMVAASRSAKEESVVTKKTALKKKAVKEAIDETASLVVESNVEPEV